MTSDMPQPFMWGLSPASRDRTLSDRVIIPTKLRADRGDELFVLSLLSKRYRRVSKERTLTDRDRGDYPRGA
jgi:hypothetical protein